VTSPRRALAVVALAVVTPMAAAGCGSATPTLAQLKSEPVLAVPDGASLLLRVNVKPRSKAIGRDGRDGAAEVVFASPQTAASVADGLQERWGATYGLHRVDNTADGAVVGSELRGRDGRTGAAIQIAVTTGRPYTLYGGPDDLARPPAGSRSYTSVAAVSQQR
jgi:hypothetical protein